jgi:hypothetical protein
MGKLYYERADYSVVVKNRAPPPEGMEVGDLPCRKCQPDQAVTGLFRDYGYRYQSAELHRERTRIGTRTGFGTLQGARLEKPHSTGTFFQMRFPCVPRGERCTNEFRFDDWTDYARRVRLAVLDGSAAPGRGRLVRQGERRAADGYLMALIVLFVFGGAITINSWK